jgi:3-oxoacyl-[acyl-carrier protein] reductase
MAQHLSGPSSLTGQVALVTGGAGGMGHAIANVFKAAGARVVATDLGEHEDIGPGIEYRRYDVTSRAHTDKVIDGVLADHGKVDILVLCAGIIARTPLAQSTDEEFDVFRERARCRKSHAQAVPDHVRARLRQDPCVWLDRR